MLLAGACAAHGAGLGKLSVFSGIGQQLNAEIALNATPAELASMSVKLASPEAFKEAGIEYMPVLSDLRIEIEKSATGEPVLKLTTARPVTEPFLHFLVELSWGSGRVVREYTFLLDPPEMLQIAKPASVVAPATPAIEPLPTPAAAVPAAPAATMTKTTPSAGGGEYQVKPGDTLSKIARETRPESVTLDQMLVALFENNPKAFVGGNMNRLRAGKILRVPAADEAAKIDPATARKLVIDQASEFAAYRRRLAGAVAATPVVASAPQQHATGTIKPQVEDKTPPPPTKDKLEVSRTEPAKAKPAAGGGSLEEDLIARDKALREAS
ncbi:MAG: FimV family protein, partial [Rhodocyclaceae bacterium]